MSKGVRCSAFAHGNAHIWDGEGSCTILKLEFVGWSKAEVKSVIGECGTGWCILYEEHEDELADIGSDISSEPDEMASSLSSIDPAQSLVLPTLDIPTNNVIAMSTQSPPPTHLPSAIDSESWSDFCLSSPGDAVEEMRSGNADSWYAYGFSSQFLDRANL